MIDDIQNQQAIDLFNSYPDDRELIELELKAMFLDVKGDLTQSQFLSGIDLREGIKILFNILLNNLTWYSTSIAPFGRSIGVKYSAYVSPLTPSFYFEDEKGLLPVYGPVGFYRFDDQENISMNGTDSKWYFFDNLNLAIESALEQLTDYELELRSKKPRVYKNKS